MSKSHKIKRKAPPPTASAAGWRLPRVAAAVLTIAVVAAGGFWWSKGRQTDAQAATAPAAGIQAANAPASAATVAPPAFDKLTGKWRRPDGGYVIEIKSVESGGKMDAAYFNPRPINVSKAEAIREGEVAKVFIELRDVKYPGSTYTLAYDPAADQLKGIYYHAGLQQQFEVFFQRMK
jgi:hypothetical protein